MSQTQTPPSEARGSRKRDVGALFWAGLLAAAVAFVLLAGLNSEGPALAIHGTAGQHGITLDCGSEPAVVADGTVVTVTYLVQNRAGVVGNVPDHNVTFTLTDDWVGDVIDPITPANQTDSLQFHQSASSSTFSEGVDQRTYQRTFVWNQASVPLVNDVILTGTFGDGDLAFAQIQCNKTKATPTPTVEHTCPTPVTLKNSALDHCVSTVAEADPNGTAQRPQVLYKWELPDMDPNTPGMQYTDGTEGSTACPNNFYGCINTDGNDVPDIKGAYHHRHDDGDPRKPPGQMQVRPNLDDKPEKRTIEIWAIVMDPNGAADIQLVLGHVYDPSGVKKLSLPLTQRACTVLGTPTNVLSPQHAAENTGQLPHGAVLQHECTKGQWRLFTGTFLLNNDQPDGKYTVRVDATDGVGTGENFENQFTVLNVVAFKIDFQAINYGLLAAGTRQVRPGNFNYGDGIPTVINTGNDEACLTLQFSDMVGKIRQGRITLFDASLWTVQPPQQLAFLAGQPGQFTGPLPPKLPVQIDFAVSPPAPLPSDQYQGTLHLSVKKQAEGCGTS